MPTVSLTPQQQASVDAANQVLANAQSVYDKALANFNSVKNNFCNDGWWHYLTDCDVRNAQSKVLDNPFTIVGVISGWTQKKWEKPSSCQEAIDKGILLTWDCDRGKGECKSVKGCNDRVGQYNAKLEGYYSASGQLHGASLQVQSAKTNLETVLANIAKDPTVQGNVDLANAEIEAKKQKELVKWAFFGLAAVIIVGEAIWIGTKLLKGGSASA